MRREDLTKVRIDGRNNKTFHEKSLEKEIYKTIASFGKGENIKVVDFLNRLDLRKIVKKEYRKIKYSYESLVKLVLFMRLKEIKSQTQVVEYLKSNKEDAKALGFEDEEIPDQRTISHFINHVLDEDTKNLIDFIIKKTEQVSDKFGIIFDVESIKVEKPKKVTSKRNRYVVGDKKTRELCRLIKKKFYPQIDLNQGKNTIYGKNDLLDLLIFLTQTSDFAENGSKTFKEVNVKERNEVPSADTLLSYLKKYSTIEEVQEMFIKMFDMAFKIAMASNLFKRKRGVDIAVDFTDWFFYGDKNTPMVVGKKPERGTSFCYRFATVNIVEADKRFTLIALPVGPFNKKENILRKLLSFVKERVNVRRLYVDRGFFTVECIKVLNEFKSKFLMPATANERVKDVMNIMPAPAVVKDYEMGDVKFNLVIVKDEKRIKRAFATNEGLSENEVGLAERLFTLYGKRWGIETSYRVKSHSFRPKTTSKNYFVRLFYFLFSVLLYNLWIMIDILICISLMGRKIKEHLITSKLFGTILCSIQLDPG
jgi:putative transposase